MSNSSETASTIPAQPAARGIAAWYTTTFAALRVRNFRLYFVGMGLSFVGNWARRTALGWLIFQMTGSYDLLGWTMGLALLPLFILSPFTGALADRVDKRKQIFAAQVLAFIVSAILAAIVFLDIAPVWAIMVLATLGGVSFAIEVPARQAFVVEMVGRDNLMNAIALNSALVNLSRIIGPAVAGVLMTFKGAGLVFAVDAVSYIGVMITLLALRLPRHIIPHVSGSQWAQMLEGIRVSVRNPKVRVAFSLVILVVGFGWCFNTLLPAICQDELKLSEREYGILMSTFGLGAIFGALYVAGLGPRARPRAQMYSGIVIMLAGLLAFTFMRNFWAMIPCLIVAGLGGITFLSTANTVVQTSVDDNIRGRVMGIWSLIFGGSLPLGSILAGQVASHLSPFTTIQVFLAIAAAGSLTVYLLNYKNRREDRHELPG